MSSDEKRESVLTVKEKTLQDSFLVFRLKKFLKEYRKEENQENLSLVDAVYLMMIQSLFVMIALTNGGML